MGAQKYSNINENALNIYKTGLSYERSGDYNKALECFTKGYIDYHDEYYAPLKMAQYWFTGNGDIFDAIDESKRLREAIAFAKIAADNNSPEAMNLLGFFYSCGENKDLSKTEFLWRKCADKYNNSIAKCLIVMVCNPEDAYELLMSAANDGLDEAVKIAQGINNNNLSEEIISYAVTSIQNKIITASPMPPTYDR